MAQGRSRIASLREAGFEMGAGGEVPAAYAEVIEGLNEAELQALVAIKRRLDQAQQNAGPDVQPYSTFFVPF